MTGGLLFPTQLSTQFKPSFSKIDDSLCPNESLFENLSNRVAIVIITRGLRLVSLKIVFLMA